MANIKDDSDNGDFIYDSEDTDDDNASKYEFARRVAVDSLVPKRSPEWTELESSVLLEAWGEKLLEYNRKNLRSEAWNEIAKKVSEASQIKRTKTNCRHRLDNLKKRYKKEKTMLAQNIGTSSSWVHFNKMDMLICPEVKEAIGHGLVNSDVHLISSSSSDELANSLGGNSESEKEKDENFVENINLDENADLDGPPHKKPRMGKEKGGDDCLKLLAGSIDKFTDLYEKVEKSKSIQLVEMEILKMDFKREMKLKRGEFMKTALTEIAKINGADIGDTDDLSLGNTSSYI